MPLTCPTICPMMTPRQKIIVGLVSVASMLLCIGAYAAFMQRTIRRNRCLPETHVPEQAWLRRVGPLEGPVSYCWPGYEFNRFTNLCEKPTCIVPPLPSHCHDTIYNALRWMMTPECRPRPRPR